MKTFAVILWVLGLICLLSDVFIFVASFKDSVIKTMRKPVEVEELFTIVFCAALPLLFFVAAAVTKYLAN